MAKVESVLVFAAVVLLIAFSSDGFSGTYSGGTGEQNDPYLIATAEDLNDIGDHPEDFNKCFLMVADINLADYTGTQFNIIGNPYSTPLAGVFDGNNYTISNFTYTQSDANYIGLFTCVDNNGKVKQLVMQNVNVSGNRYTAGLVGINFGKICDCTITGAISGNYHTGGLAGLNGGEILDCTITGTISGDDNTGGLAGGNYGEVLDCSVAAQIQGVEETGGLVGDNHGTISDCYAEGEVSGCDEIGGLVGDNHGIIWNCYANSIVDGNSAIGKLVGGNVGLIGDGLISGCYATGSVSGYDAVGGLVGWNVDGTISYCYTTGIVEGNNGTGGLVGWNVSSTISNCYSTASVLGDDHIGGLVGASSGSTISNCFAVGVVDGNNYTGGLIGGNHDGMVDASFWDVNTTGQLISDGGEGKTTAEMKTEGTFTDAGWDFIEIWDIGENQTYPFLRTHPAGDINHNDIVNFCDLAILAEHWLQGTP